ncbi:class I SAM-dependent methyltransferase [Steroidobacter sp.]|uniref:class I SAM-dependent methyltransferase n=1 Tax=Steroidobacter sp. TaxID=1978227 RepID=UPI001A590697|nr:class I SAM-dependent methyltransferase [Steroidobacter sp.]MBL8271324.1 class I SAM-dependent methyltransferase [Steroidobacter sp.]
MTGRRGRDEKPLYEAIIDAQKLAFAPLAFHATLALRDLGILAKLADARAEGLTAEQVAELTKVPIYGVKVLLESGVVSDLIALEDGRYYLRQLGLLVLRDAMTRVNMDFAADVCYRGMAHLRETVTTGKPMGLQEFGSWNTIYEGLTQLPPHVQRSWLAFDHYYSDHMFPNALPLVFADAPKRLLDVGANTGKFALTCLEHNPQVHVSLLDFAGQLELARKAIAAKGHEARASFHPIDFLNPALEFPGNQDVIWMSQFLDCFSEDEIVSILERARRALAPHGRIYIVETYWDHQEHAAARFVLTMTSLYFASLANGNSKMYLSEDMRGCVQRAGLKIEREMERFSPSHTMFVCRAG